MVDWRRAACSSAAIPGLDDASARSLRSSARLPAARSDLSLASGKPRPCTSRAPSPTLIETAVCHRDPERYALLYRLVWRVLHGERELLEIASRPARPPADADGEERCGATSTRCTPSCASAQVEGEAERYVALFEPEHFILEAAAPFFVDRFRALDWSILTPIGSAALGRASAELRPAGDAAPRRRTATPSRRAGAAITRAPSTRPA